MNYDTISEEKNIYKSQWIKLMNNNKMSDKKY